jgi:hypothetical protein
MTERQRRFDWYLNVVLASITALLMLVALALNALMLTSGEGFPPVSNPALEFPRVAGFAALFVVLSVFWFWLRMLNDYFRNRPAKHTVAWGWALFLLNIPAALAYFWLIWRPRNGHLHQTAA